MTELKGKALTCFVVCSVSPSPVKVMRDTWADCAEKKTRFTKLLGNFIQTY
jgi:hypothetical protein